MKKLVLAVLSLWLTLATSAFAVNIDATGSAASSVSGTDLFECEQGGVNNHCSAAILSVYMTSLLSGDCTVAANVITCTKINGAIPLVSGGALGTPSSGTATNLSGTAAGLTAGHVTTNANLTGDVTSSGNATMLTNAPVIAKVLTGYVSGAGTVSATDSILSAIQKLNGNIAAAVGTVTSVSAGCGTSTGGSPITTTGTVTAALTRRANATTSDTIVAADCGNIVSESNASSIAVAIAQAGTTGFAAGTFFKVCNIGAGTATITPTTSTIGGASTLAIAGGSAAAPVCYAFQSDGTNYNLTDGPTVNASLLSAGTVAAARGGAGTVNGALKGNGSGTVSQAACADLSNGATGCSTATGTSGATIGLLNGNNTQSGNNTHTGAETFAEVHGGTRTVSTTTDTLAASDCGKTITYSNASAVTVTIPQGLPVVCVIAIVQIGSGKVSVNGSAVTPATLHTNVASGVATGTSGQYATIGLTNYTTNTVVLTGDGS